MFNKRKKIVSLSVCVTALVALSACQPATTKNYNSEDAQINNVLERAANKAAMTGQERENLVFLEKLYTRNSKDVKVAMRYAAGLRDAGRLVRAALVLAPFAEQPEEEDIAAVIEYASVLAEMGEYLKAEEYARMAVMIDPEASQGYHILGIALDAQGHHKQGEVALRRALDVWEGDPSLVMNNLGLNLAAQGHLDEAIDTLRKAKVLAPNRIEIERNIRIVSALQVRPPKTGTRLIPMPPRIPQKKLDNAE